MEALVLILATIYAFVVGHVFVSKADRFMNQHPQAFPGRRRITVVDPSLRHDISDDPAFCTPAIEGKEAPRVEKNHS